MPPCRAVRPVRGRARPRAPPAAASIPARGPRSERPDPRRPARAPARRPPADDLGACPRESGRSPGASWRRRRRVEPRGAAGRAGATGPESPGPREAAAAQRGRRGRSSAVQSGPWPAWGCTRGLSVGCGPQREGARTWKKCSRLSPSLEEKSGQSPSRESPFPVVKPAVPALCLSSHLPSYPLSLSYGVGGGGRAGPLGDLGRGKLLSPPSPITCS